MPVYLRFVKGVIDSADLPLNVSRELLQESRDVKAIREGSTKKVLSMLEDVAENQKDTYAEFWAQFGNVLKEGIGEDFANRERLATLFRFASTHADSGVSFADWYHPQHTDRFEGLNDPRIREAYRRVWSRSSEGSETRKHLRKLSDPELELLAAQEDFI
jgi:HSP90 family molecular chaperone